MSRLPAGLAGATQPNMSGLFIRNGGVGGGGSTSTGGSHSSRTVGGGLLLGSTIGGSTTSGVGSGYSAQRREGGMLMMSSGMVHAELGWSEMAETRAPSLPRGESHAAKTADPLPQILFAEPVPEPVPQSK